MYIFIIIIMKIKRADNFYKKKESSSKFTVGRPSLQILWLIDTLDISGLF